MPSAWLNDFMASLESNSAVRQPTTQEIAADIIRKSNRYRYGIQAPTNRGYAQAASAAKASSSKGPSTIQRVLDVISRPLYGITNAIEDVQLEANKNNPSHPEISALDALETGATGFWKGLSGKEKTSTRDIFEASGRSDNKGFKAGLRNFVLDAAVDPLNLVSGAGLVKGVKGLRDLRGAEEATTATERVERALNSPAEILRRSNRNTSVPNLRRIEGKTNPPLDPVASRVKSTAGLPRTLPAGQTRPINLGGGTLRETAKVAPKVEKAKTTVQEVLKDIVPQPTRKIDPKALGVPPRAVPTAAKFKLDVNKIAGIEIARAVAPKSTKTSAEYAAGKALVDSGESVPVYTLNGKQTGGINAQMLHEFFRTGKAKIPKESEVPEFGSMPNEQLDEYWKQFMVPDKGDLDNLYLKNVDEAGNESLVSLREVRKRIALVAKSKKLKDTIPDEPAGLVPADTTAWRKSARNAGLTRSEIDKVLKAENDDDALRLLQEFADKPIKLPAAAADTLPEVADFEIASAQDIVDAAGEGSQTAAKAMEEAAAATAPRHSEVLSEQGGRAVAKVAAHYSNLVKQATFRNANFNPAKQANAFRMLEQALIDEGLMAGFTKVPKDKILTASVGKIADVRRSIAMKHLVALEDAMTVAGHPPMTFGKGAYPMRMSDLINAAGGIHHVLSTKNAHLTDLFGTAAKYEKFLEANPEALQLAEKARAAHAAATADLVDKGKQAALSAAQKAEMDPSLTAAERSAAVSEAPAVARDVVKATEGVPNPEAARMAAENVKQIIDMAKPPVNKVAERYSRHFNSTVLTGRVTPDTVKGSVAAEKAALELAGVNTGDIAAEVSKAGDSAASQGLVAGLMKAFKPDFRQEDIRPIVIENRSLFQTNTSRWAHALSETFKKYDKPTRLNAWKSLTTGRAASDTEAAAAKEFQDAMESMFGPTGFKDAVNSDIRREAITMDEVNRHLSRTGSKFQFSKEVKNELGRPVKLGDWTDAWKYHDLDGQDSVEFIKQMRDAVDRSMLDKTMFDQIATIFGKPGKTSINHPRLRGIEFPSEIKPQVARFLESLDDIAKPNGKFAQHYDQALRAWKSGVTIYSPSHHIRNFIGDTYIAWLAGVNNPKVYWKAASVLKSNRHLYDDMKGVDTLLDPKAAARSISRQAKVPVVRAAGKQLDAEQIYTIMYNKGLLPHSRVIEDIPSGGVTELRLPQPLGGRGKKVARGVSESREHFSRIAHFIDALGKSKAPTVERAIDDASRIVRKWHPDGLDLTDFEHRWVRRVFPFYSWTRKAIPLMVEGAVKRPSKIIAPNKLLYNLQVSMGLDPESMSEPFPVDKEFPDWIRDMAYGPIAGGGNLIVGSNLNPFTSVGEQLANDPRRGIAGLLTPAVRVPGEILSQSDWQTGQPMDTMDKTEYIDKQIPLVSVANRLTQGNLGAGSVEALATGNVSAMMNHKANEGTGSATANRDAFLNYMLAAGIIDTQSPANLKSAEFDRRDRVAAQRKKLQGG